MYIIYMYNYIYIHIHTYTYIHTHICTIWFIDNHWGLSKFLGDNGILE